MDFSADAVLDLYEPCPSHDDGELVEPYRAAFQNAVSRVNVESQNGVDGFLSHGSLHLSPCQKVFRCLPAPESQDYTYWPANSVKLLHESNWNKDKLLKAGGTLGYYNVREFVRTCAELDLGICFESLEPRNTWLKLFLHHIGFAQREK